MTETARLRLPEIAASQAQKHVTHNDALVALDTLVQPAVISKGLTAPPGSPSEGDCYIVAGAGGTATGAWVSWENRIARFQDGQWTSYLPGAGSGNGWTVWVQDEATLYTFNGTAWLNALRGKTGGGISIQYNFSTTTTDSDPGAGALRLNNATQNIATVIRADLLDYLATDWTAALNTFADSTNPIKGHIRLFSANDPSKWLLFSVSAVATPTGYRNITVAPIASSAASPFANGEGVILSFTRSGDAGVGVTTVYAAEVNVGAAARHSGHFSLVDPNIGLASKLIVSLAPGPYTGKGTRADEAEMYAGLHFMAAPGSGLATVYWTAPRGGALRGNIKLNYIIG